MDNEKNALAHRTAAEMDVAPLAPSSLVIAAMAEDRTATNSSISTPDIPQSAPRTESQVPAWTSPITEIDKDGKIDRQENLPKDPAISCSASSSALDIHQNKTSTEPKDPVAISVLVEVEQDGKPENEAESITKDPVSISRSVSTSDLDVLQNTTCTETKDHLSTSVIGEDEQDGRAEHQVESAMKDLSIISRSVPSSDSDIPKSRTGTESEDRIQPSLIADNEQKERANQQLKRRTEVALFISRSSSSSASDVPQRTTSIPPQRTTGTQSQARVLPSYATNIAQNGKTHQQFGSHRQNPIFISRALQFPPIADRLVEMIYFGDPGYFFKSKSGCMYHIWHTSQPETARFGPRSLKFQLDCPPLYKQAAYQNVYQRWYFNFMEKPEWSSFESACLTWVPEQGYSLHSHIIAGILVGSRALDRGESREDAIITQQKVEQEAKAGRFPMDPNHFLYDHRFPAELVWNGVPVEDRAPLPRGEQGTRNTHYA